MSLTDKVEDLLRHEADIAIRMVQPTQAAVVATRVGRVALGMFATAEFLAQHGTPKDMPDLQRFPRPSRPRPRHQRPARPAQR